MKLALTHILGIERHGRQALLVHVVVDFPAYSVSAFQVSAAHHWCVQMVRGHETLSEQIVVLFETYSAAFTERSGSTV